MGLRAGGLVCALRWAEGAGGAYSALRTSFELASTQTWERNAVGVYHRPPTYASSAEINSPNVGQTALSRSFAVGASWSGRCRYCCKSPRRDAKEQFLSHPFHIATVCEI